ncbi:MAG: YybH family protein [Gemmatimonadales bacterium]
MGPISEEDKTTIRNQTAAFATAVNAKDWATAASMYVDDAVFMPANGETVTGRNDIQTWMAAYPPFSNFVANSVEIDGVGDLAYNRGTFELDVTPPGATAPMHDKGKFLEVLRRQPDGSWKVIRDIFNSDLPLPMAK